MARRSREDMAAAAAQTANELAQLTADRPVERQESESAQEKKDDPIPRVEPRNEPRRQAMDELIAKRAPKEEPAHETVTEQPAKAQEPETPVVAPAQQRVEQTPETPAPKMAKVKVDGEEFEVPQEEVDSAGGVAIYQRERAADNRLRRANENLAETRKVQAQIAEWISQNTPKPTPETPEKYIAERVDALRFGTQEESAKALQEILSKTNQQLDPNVVTGMAVSRVREDMAINDFKREFADVVANPLLLKLAITLEHEKKKQLKQTPDWGDFYRSVGNEVRSVIGRPNQPKEAQVTSGTTSQPDKEERKSSIVNLPSAASRAALPEAEKPETREDILNSMRKKRGIPTG